MIHVSHVVTGSVARLKAVAFVKTPVFTDYSPSSLTVVSAQHRSTGGFVKRYRFSPFATIVTPGHRYHRR
jgi:hypothetical protein